MLDSVKNEVTKILMTVRIQSTEQLGQAAEEMENRAEAISNVTYTAPTETGEVQTTLDSAASARRAIAAAATSLATGDVPRVGRNEPCPCGSGKKYKQCHGKLV